MHNVTGKNLGTAGRKDFFRPAAAYIRKKDCRKTSFCNSPILWQRVKDLNPHIRSQSPLCYHYTNPLSV